MKSEPLACAEIRDGFVAGGVPAGPAVRAHLAACPHCPELFENDARLGRRLASAASPELAPDGLFAQIERDVARDVGLRARLRAQPRRVRVAALLGVAGALFVFELASNRRGDFAQYRPSLFWSVAFGLGLALVMGVLALSRGANAPLGSHSRRAGLAVLLLGLPAVSALLAPLGAGSLESVTAWGNPASCFAYGAALVLPLLVLSWLFERRDAVPLSALVAAGGVAGVAANLLLHAHCGSVNPGHLLLGHASVGLACALALRLVWRSPQPSR